MAEDTKKKKKPTHNRHQGAGGDTPAPSPVVKPDDPHKKRKKHAPDYGAVKSNAAFPDLGGVKGNRGRANYMEYVVGTGGKRGAVFHSGRFKGKTPAQVRSMAAKAWDRMSEKNRDRFRNNSEGDRERDRQAGLQADKDKFETDRAQDDARRRDLGMNGDSPVSKPNPKGGYTPPSNQEKDGGTDNKVVSKPEGTKNNTVPQPDDAGFTGPVEKPKKKGTITDEYGTFDSDKYREQRHRQVTKEKMDGTFAEKESERQSQRDRANAAEAERRKRYGTRVRPDGRIDMSQDDRTAAYKERDEKASQDAADKKAVDDRSMDNRWNSKRNNQIAARRGREYSADQAREKEAFETGGTSAWEKSRAETEKKKKLRADRDKGEFWKDKLDNDIVKNSPVSKPSRSYA